MHVFSESPVKDLNAGHLSVTLFSCPSWECASSHSHTAAINAGIGEAIIEQGLEAAMQGHQHVAVASLSVAPASNLQKSIESRQHTEVLLDAMELADTCSTF